MKNIKTLIILPLLFISLLAYLPGSFHTARASLTGNVCLQPSGTVGCPGAPVLFASFPGTLMVAVNIVGSDPLNGFDVSIKTDPTVLAASGASLTGTIVTSATVLLKCLDGVLVVGTACASQDGAGVLHFSAVKTGTTVAGSGLLFTAVYTVVSASPGISVDFAVDAIDCASTSVAGGVCVSISNGTTIFNSETTTGASFSNVNDFTITASPSSFTPPASLAPGVTGTSTLTLTSLGGFSDFIDLTVFPSAGLSASIPPAPTTLLLPAGGSVSTTLSVSAAVSGAYTALVSASADLILQPVADTHTVTVPVTVTPPDFSVSASPTFLHIAPGDSGTSMITVTSISGFSSTVSLTATVSPAGPTASLSPASCSPSCSSTLTVTVPGGTASGNYTVTVTGTGSGAHAVAITVNVGEEDFSLLPSPSVLNIPRVNPIRTGASILKIASLNNFAAMLTVTMSISGPVAQVPGEIPGVALTATLTKTSITLSSGGSDNSTLIMTVLKASTGTGLHTVTVTVSGGGKTHTVQVLAYVTDFTMTLRDPAITVLNTPSVVPAQTVMTVRAVGAPNQTISQGFDIAAPPPSPQVLGSTIQAYTFTPSSGRIIDQLPSTDTTKRRCYHAVFDSNNNLITPTLDTTRKENPLTNLIRKHVTSFLAPLVHINGDADGDPPDFNGCRFDSGAGPSFFGTGPSPPVKTGGKPVDDFPMPSVEVLPGVPDGSYTAKVCYLGGIVLNCVPWQITLIPVPVLPGGLPLMNQFNWKNHKISLSTDTVQTFTAGVSNNATNPTLYVAISILAIDVDGDIVHVVSGVFIVPPGRNTNNIVVNMELVSCDACPVSPGVVDFAATIAWSTTPFPTAPSTGNLGNASKNTGSFLVSP